MAKYKKILYMGFRATLTFRKFKLALNPMYRYKRLKVNLGVFLAGHRVATVTYCVTKIIPTCSPVTGQFFDTMIVASIDKD